MVVKWRFENVNQVGDDAFWEFEVSPSEGGLPSIEHQITPQSHVGPWPSAILMEGRPEPPRIQFRGKIISQSQYEAMELWYMRRILLDLVDDVGRRFRGVLSRWDPSRIRRPYDPWYHEYEAEFLVWAGQNASGAMIFGHMATSDVYVPPPEPDPEPPGDAPDAPTGLLASYVSATEIDISWGVVEEAATYDVERDGDIIATGVVGSFYTDENATGSHTYRVRAVDAHGQFSEWSDAYETETNGDTLSYVFKESAYIMFALTDADGLEIEIADDGSVLS